MYVAAEREFVTFKKKVIALITGSKGLLQATRAPLTSHVRNQC